MKSRRSVFVIRREVSSSSGAFSPAQGLALKADLLGRLPIVVRGYVVFLCLLALQ
jgi:hypothetical protein